MRYPASCRFRRLPASSCSADVASPRTKARLVAAPAAGTAPGTMGRGGFSPRRLLRHRQRRRHGRRGYRQRHDVRRNQSADHQAAAEHPHRARCVGLDEPGFGQRYLRHGDDARLRRELEVGAVDPCAQPCRHGDGGDGQLGPQAVRRRERRVRRQPHHGGCPRRNRHRAMINTVITARTDPMGNVLNGSSTPTRRAMDAAVTYFAGVTEPNPEVHPARHRRVAQLHGDRQQPERRHAGRDHGRGQRRGRRVSRPSSSAFRRRPARRTTP